MRITKARIYNFGDFDCTLNVFERQFVHMSYLSDLQKTQVLQALVLPLLGDKRIPPLDDFMLQEKNKGRLRGCIDLTLQATNDEDDICEIQLKWDREDLRDGYKVKVSGNKDCNDWFVAAYGSRCKISRPPYEDVQYEMSDKGRAPQAVTLLIEDATLARAFDWLMDLYCSSLEDLNGPERTATSIERGKETEKQIAAVLSLLNDKLCMDTQIEKISVDGFSCKVATHPCPFPQIGLDAKVKFALVADILRHIRRKTGKLDFRRFDQDWFVPDTGFVFIDRFNQFDHPTHFQTWLVTHFPNVQFIVT